MTQTIVHGLEAIYVYQNDMKVFGIGFGGLALQAVHEQGAIGKAGHPVINRIVEKAFLGSFGVCDV